MRGLEREEQRSIEFEEPVEYNSKVELSINISWIALSSYSYQLYPWQRLKIGVDILTVHNFYKLVLYPPNPEIDNVLQIRGFHLTLSDEIEPERRGIKAGSLRIGMVTDDVFG